MKLGDALVIIAVSAIAFYVGSQCAARETVRVVPQIITRYDTVPVTPQWLLDSLKKLADRKPTRDTTEIVIEHTIIDTEYVNVGADPEQRPNIWPLLTYQGGTEFGDTAIVTSFSLRNGTGSAAKVFIPGILTGIEADSNAIPKLIFEPFPKPKGPSFLYTLKTLGLGFGTGVIACSLTR